MAQIAIRALVGLLAPNLTRVDRHRLYVLAVALCGCIYANNTCAQPVQNAPDTDLPVPEAAQEQPEGARGLSAYEVRAESTLGWGCPCPTWVRKVATSKSGGKYLMALQDDRATLDPTDVAVPNMVVRMQGRFTGEKITGEEWQRIRKRSVRGFPVGMGAAAAIREYWNEPGDVFIFSSWCFENTVSPRDRVALKKLGARSCER